MRRRVVQPLIGGNNNTNSGFPMDLGTLCKQGRLREALQLLNGMDNCLKPSTYASLLRLCTGKKFLAGGKLVHQHMDRMGFKPDMFLRNTMVNMYTKCGSLEDARQVFDEMPQRDVCSWTVMVATYSKHGLAQETFEMFHQMQIAGIQPNEFTLASVIPACAVSADLHQGMKIHGHVIRCGFQADVFVQSGLVDMYAKCGRIDFARYVFDKMPERDVHSWTAMVSAYSKHGPAQEAVTLFREMQQSGLQPNHFTFASVLPACAQLAALEHGIEIHEFIISCGFHTDLFVQSGLIDMYAKCGCLARAQYIFDKMQQHGVVAWNALIAGYAQNGYVEKAFDLFLKIPERDTISWNVMISGYVQNGYLDEAVKLFWEMPERNVTAWNAIIIGYAQNGCVTEAYSMFQMMPHPDNISWNAMISAYAKKRHSEEAYELFQKMPNPNVVSWTALISGCAQNGQSEEALNLFGQMQLAGVQPDSKAFATALSACANLADMEQGMLFHETIIRSGFLPSVLVENALIDMYAKCGNLDKARDLFDKMHQRNLVSWNVMISGYAIHGRGKEALQIFEQMQQFGTTPSDVTFVSILCACCHAGLVDEGQQYFDSMTEFYHITPSMEHYVFMVDLLGRAGLLNKAEDFIHKMEMHHAASLWRCLLGACGIHKNVEIGERAAGHLYELDPNNGANYVLMSNIYLAAGRWEDAENVRRMMKNRSIKKMPGYSWIEVDKQVHVFRSGNKLHAQTPNIIEDIGENLIAGDGAEECA
ncbi:pentatricopeptide repeat-containing protein At3g16610 [Cryptomeria japonica]|uniref:pentatricopeptide repeat-containing protein At3g16610 n=1 Tax=Cryptomeria japonica TaxID=3369 RepID=UPI0027D9EA0E|nr:pentatricopeptide repeat-containing protein At3g16610 [Cryptomeria japonica]